MKNFIKEWWDKLPESNSGAYELDKTILRALWKEIKSTLFISIIGLLTDIAIALSNTLSSGESFKMQFNVLIVAFTGSMIENVIIFLRKLKKDYTK